MAEQVVGYVRVSCSDQNPAHQVAAVGTAEETFTDTVSGGSRVERTALATVLRHVRRGDTVKVASWTASPALWSTSPSSSPS